MNTLPCPKSSSSGYTVIIGEPVILTPTTPAASGKAAQSKAPSREESPQVDDGADLLDIPQKTPSTIVNLANLRNMAQMAGLALAGGNAKTSVQTRPSTPVSLPPRQIGLSASADASAARASAPSRRGLLVPMPSAEQAAAAAANRARAASNPEDAAPGVRDTPQQATNERDAAHWMPSAMNAIQGMSDEDAMAFIAGSVDAGLRSGIIGLGQRGLLRDAIASNRSPGDTRTPAQTQLLFLRAMTKVGA